MTLCCNHLIYPISNIEGFRYFININKDKIVYLWDEFLKNNCIILELEIELGNEFNDLALSFNDFQYIMPSPVNETLFDPYIYKRNDLIQSHLPYIKKSDIKNVYKIFELD